MKFTPTDSTMRAILGCMITGGFFGVVFFVLLYPVPPAVRDIVLVLLGALIASFKEVTGFFFGSSSNAVTAAETIATQAAASMPPFPPTTSEVPAVVKIDDSVPIKVEDVKS